MKKDIRSSLGCVVAGMIDEITLFGSTDVALQDLVVADLAIRRATEQGLGVTADH